MVRRLRMEKETRQLGLFGEGLALGIRPKAATLLPSVQSLADAVKATSILKSKPSIIGARGKHKKISRLPPEIVRPPEAASLLSVSLSLLKKWRLAGSEPRFVRLGRRAIGYRRVDLLAWVEGLTR
jgi:predicted DNA-binding transcriptional regulator AlpA